MPLTGAAKTEWQRKRRAERRAQRDAQAPAEGRQVVTGRQHTARSSGSSRGRHPKTPTTIRDARLAKVLQEETDGLSPKEIIAAQALMSGASRSDAARAAGYSPTSGSLRKGGPIHSACIRALHRAGATRTKAAKVVSESLDAHDTKFFPTIATRQKIGTCAECGEEFDVIATTIMCPSCRSSHFSVREELDLPSRDLVAHGHRLDAAELVFRLHGDLTQADKGGSQPANGPIVAIQFVQDSGPHVASPDGASPVTTGITFDRYDGGNGHGNGNH